MFWIASALAILAMAIFGSLVLGSKVGFLWMLAASIVGLISFVALAAAAIWIINWMVMRW